MKCDIIKGIDCEYAMAVRGKSFIFTFCYANYSAIVNFQDKYSFIKKINCKLHGFSITNNANYPINSVQSYETVSNPRK